MSPAQSSPPDISIVIPAHDEADNIGALVDEVARVFSGQNHEIVIVNDGSADRTSEVLNGIVCPSLRVITHMKRAGQSRAIRTGILAARASIICTLDGDGQNPAMDLPDMVEVLRDGAQSDPPLGLVIGERTTRRDELSRAVASFMARIARKALFGDDVPDAGCGTRVMLRSAYLHLPYFDHQHRFLPLLMRREGFGVVSIPVGHRPRHAGRSKYSGPARLLASLWDLMGIGWLLARNRDPGEIRED